MLIVGAQDSSFCWSPALEMHCTPPFRPAMAGRSSHPSLVSAMRCIHLGRQEATENRVWWVCRLLELPCGWLVMELSRETEFLVSRCILLVPSALAGRLMPESRCVVWRCTLPVPWAPVENHFWAWRYILLAPWGLAVPSGMARYSSRVRCIRLCPLATLLLRSIAPSRESVMECESVLFGHQSLGKDSAASCCSLRGP